jgi:uncharacterized membrane protein (DUF485 family)
MEKKKKSLGALLAGILVILYFGFFLFISISGGLFTDPEIPKFVIIVILFAFLLPIIGVIIALVSRMREINSGEEEEAKKY